VKVTPKLRASHNSSFKSHVGSQMRFTSFKLDLCVAMNHLHSACWACGSPSLQTETPTAIPLITKTVLGIHEKLGLFMENRVFPLHFRFSFAWEKKQIF